MPYGLIVPKEKLLKTVWPDTFVEEGSLTRNISTLRKALGESPDDQKYIATFPKRGYRFVASVIMSEPPDTLLLGPQDSTSVSPEQPGNLQPPPLVGCDSRSCGAADDAIRAGRCLMREKAEKKSRAPSLPWSKALQFLEPVQHEHDLARADRVRAPDHHEAPVRENVVPRSRA